MTYEKLTKEQFASLAFEFTQFLAIQKIDKQEWEKIKTTNPILTEELLSIFSDIVWDDVLQKASYAEHFSKHIVNLFYFEEKFASRIVLQSNQINFLEIDDLSSILKDTQKNSIEIFQGKKAYQSNKKQELFSLIKQGAILTEGSIYKQLQSFLH